MVIFNTSSSCDLLPLFFHKNPTGHSCFDPDIFSIFPSNPLTVSLLTTVVGLPARMRNRSLFFSKFGTPHSSNRSSNHSLLTLYALNTVFEADEATFEADAAAFEAAFEADEAAFETHFPVFNILLSLRPNCTLRNPSLVTFARPVHSLIFSISILFRI